MTLKMAKEKNIGIVAKQYGDIVGVPAQYWDYLSGIAEVVVINPLSLEVEDVDLLVLPGGPDLKMYDGAIPSAHTGSPDVFLEYFDANMLGAYIEDGVPVFGICRGMQAINAHFGGGITQHKRMKKSIYRWEEVEEIILLDRKKIKVNSLHHQAIMPDQLAKGLTSLATSVKHGNVEAIHHIDMKVAGVQWHPEELDEEADASHLVLSMISTMLGR